LHLVGETRFFLFTAYNPLWAQLDPYSRDFFQPLTRLSGCKESSGLMRRKMLKCARVGKETFPHEHLIMCAGFSQNAEGR